MRKIRPEYEQIAMYCIENYIELEDLKEHMCCIAFLGSDKEKKNKGKKVYADCTKIPAKYKWMSGDRPYDFMITVYEPNCVGFSDEQMEILMMHELMHIGVEVHDDCTPKYFINDHDVQDFRAILELYGVDWADPKSGQMTFADYRAERKGKKNDCYGMGTAEEA